MASSNLDFQNHKDYVRMKNTSGGALAAGDVVTLKAVAAGDEVTTTTTAGDDKVFGMAIEAISNNAYGRIQRLGKTTVLKVNGTTDIAIGDFLATYTSAGIAAKAVQGDTAFAIALEAYTTNDSNGVIDAILIEPRPIDTSTATGDVTAASSFGTDNRVIRSDGTGKGVQSSGITVDDSNNVSGVGTLGSGAITSTGASSMGSLTLTTDLAVADGGTGVSTFTDAGVLIGNGTGAIQVTSAGTSGQVLTSNGAGVDPTFQTPASSGVTYAPSTDLDNSYITFQVPILALTTTTLAGWDKSNLTVSVGEGAGSYSNIVSSGGSTYVYTFLPGNGADDNLEFNDSKTIRLKVRVRLNETTNIKSWGIANSVSAMYESQTNTARTVRFVENAGTLYAHNANGTTATSTDVSSGITRTQWNTYEIIFTPGVDAKFYINNSLKATHTTNLPTTGTIYIAYGLNTNGEALRTTAPVMSISI